MATSKGSLKILIGAAPGVGKTYSMLLEGHRLQSKGKDVAIAYLETHGRRATAEQSKSLPRVPRHTALYRGMRLSEMDLPAVLHRHPDVALVDELAHTNVPGSKHEKRWQDVQDILDAGIDVITTINVQHIESLNDVVRGITGSTQKETVPDTFLRSADQVEVVDIPPQMLRERLSAGLVYAPDRIDAALSNYFRMGNLTALRELALLWLAGNVEQALKKYREEQGIKDKWETRERVVVALSGGPEGEMLLRRGARVAAHAGGGELLAVHVTSSDGLRSGNVRQLIRQRALVEKLGGSFHQVVGEDIVDSIIEFSKAVNATQIVIGVSSRGPFRRHFGRPSVSANLIRRSASIDVHIVTHDNVRRSFALPKLKGSLPWKRRVLALVFSAVTLPLLTYGLMQAQNTLGMPGDILTNQLIVVLSAIIGGVIPAVISACASAAIIDYFFIAPLGTFDMYQGFGLVALIMYVVIALIFSYIVDSAERRSRAAQRARAESELLSSISGNVLRSRNPLRALVDRTAEAFGFTKVVLQCQDGTRVVSDRPCNEVVDRNAQKVEAALPAEVTDSGAESSENDEMTMYQLNDGKATFTTYGNDINANDQRLLNTILTQVETVLEHNDLERKASEVEPLTEADKIRTALLNALSHDLRRPLASATAAVSGLKRDRGKLDDHDRRELLNVASNGLRELTRLVTDLLDVSRLREDALPITLVATDPEAVIVAALDELSIGPAQVSLDITQVPLVCADPPLLRRAISNLLLNAKRFNPMGKRIGILLSGFQRIVEIRIIDYGPGVSNDRKNKIFTPFQRLGDTDNTTGLGLGLALSKGFAESMGGSLSADDTPGGGLTMVITLRTVNEGVKEGEPIPTPPVGPSGVAKDIGSLILPLDASAGQGEGQSGEDFDDGPQGDIDDADDESALDSDEKMDDATDGDGLDDDGRDDTATVPVPVPVPVSVGGDMPSQGEQGSMTIESTDGGQG